MMVKIQVFDGTNFIFLENTFQNIEINKFENEIGTFSFKYPLKSPNSQFYTRQIVKIQVDSEFYAGRIMRIQTVLDGGIEFSQVEGYGIELEFNEDYTVPNVNYIQANTDDILNPAFSKTIIRPNTWSVINSTPTGVFHYLASHMTTTKLFSILYEKTGYAWRYIGDDVNIRQIEFYDTNNRVLRNDLILKQGDPLNCDGNIIISEISIEENAEQLFNHLQVMGGGESGGLNQLTLRDVDSTLITQLGYAISISSEQPNDNVVYDNSVFNQTRTGANNYESYYIEDTASILKYGRVKQSIEYKDETVMSNAGGDGREYTDTNRIDSANELYKRAVNAIIEHKDPHITYNVKIVGDLETLKVGEMLHLKYTGRCNMLCAGGSSSYKYIDIEQDFIVRGKTLKVSGNSKSYEVELTNVAKRQDTDFNILKTTVDTVQSYSKQRHGDTSHFMRQYEGLVGYNLDYIINFDLNKNFERINYFKLRVYLEPATVISILPWHTHNIFIETSPASGTPVFFDTGFLNSSNGGLAITDPNNTNGFGVPPTVGFPEMIFGQVPVLNLYNVKVYINGIDITTALAGTSFINTIGVYPTLGFEKCDILKELLGAGQSFFDFFTTAGNVQEIKVVVEAPHDLENNIYSVAKVRIETEEQYFIGSQ